MVNETENEDQKDINDLLRELLFRFREHARTNLGFLTAAIDCQEPSPVTDVTTCTDTTSASGSGGDGGGGDDATLAEAITDKVRSVTSQPCVSVSAYKKLKLRWLQIETILDRAESNLEATPQL